MANIPIGGQLSPSASVASLDVRFGPYSSIQSAYDAIVDNFDEIVSGLHFGIIQSDGSIKEYAWTLTGGDASDYKEIGEGGESSVTVVDSLNSTSSTAALSAKQGKVLSEQLATRLSSPIQISDVAGLQNALNNAGGSGEGGASVTVVDNLTSNSTTSALSANQGSVIAGMISDVQDSIGEVQASIAVTKDDHNNIKDSISTIEYTAGNSNVALGGGSVKTRSGSIAIGSLAKTNVTTNPTWGSPYMANATSIGYKTEANGYMSTAVGVETVTSNVHSAAYGVFNKPTTNSIVTIGCGYRNTDSNGTIIKVNAFETDTTQKVYIRGIGGYTGEEATDAAKAGKDVQTAFSAKQDKLTAGQGIAISSNNTISTDSINRYYYYTTPKGYCIPETGANANTARGLGSFVVGRKNTGFGEDSFVAGSGNNVSSYAGAAVGVGHSTSGNSNFFCGQYSNCHTNGNDHYTQFAVGVGSSSSSRINALEVYNDGKVYIKGVGGYNGTNMGTSDTITDIASTINSIPTFEALSGNKLKITFGGHTYTLDPDA